MNVSAIMTKTLININMDNTLVQIQKLFEKHNFHHVLVVEEGELLGVISDRDILRELSPFINTPSERPLDINTLNKKAHQIMSRKPITVNLDTNIEKASSTLFYHKISCLPVLGEDGKLEGILTWKDILKYYVTVATKVNTKKRNTAGSKIKANVLGTE